MEHADRVKTLSHTDGSGINVYTREIDPKRVHGQPCGRAQQTRKRKVTIEIEMNTTANVLINSRTRLRLIQGDQHSLGYIPAIEMSAKCARQGCITLPPAFRAGDCRLKRALVLYYLPSEGGGPKADWAFRSSLDLNCGGRLHYPRPGPRTCIRAWSRVWEHDRLMQPC